MEYKSTNSSTETFSQRQSEEITLFLKRDTLILDGLKTAQDGGMPIPKQREATIETQLSLSVEDCALLMKMGILSQIASVFTTQTAT